MYSVAYLVVLMLVGLLAQYSSLKQWFTVYIHAWLVDEIEKTHPVPVGKKKHCTTAQFKLATGVMMVITPRKT